jgi:hypothetical protein
MKNKPTCGKGLAEHAALPAKLGDLIASLARNLEVHREALDPEDESSREEREAYMELGEAHRKIATDLGAAALRMAAYRDLPMGRHDQKSMSGPEVFRAFEDFVTVEEELLAMLQNRLKQDRRMLGEMGGSAT